MSTDLEIRNVVVVQGRGELAGQGRRWEHLTWGVLSRWDRVDKQHSLSGVLAAQSGSGSLEQNGHRAGHPPKEAEQSGLAPFIIILCPVWLLFLTPGAQPRAGHCSLSPPRAPHDSAEATGTAFPGTDSLERVPLPSSPPQDFCIH